ncbi:MAG TPA: hypothetical protein VEX60_04770 [Pyrinomonadaceae bacterium]|nr:hypothetical protein [Pyrinomonadaceae bacterium]
MEASFCFIGGDSEFMMAVFGKAVEPLSSWLSERLLLPHHKF